MLQAMLKDRKLENIVDLYVELLPMKQAFPTVICFLAIALTISIPSTSCERTVSQMELIKTEARKSMLNTCLGDLSVLVIEPDSDVDSEKRDR